MSATCGDPYGDLICDGPARHEGPHSAFVGQGRFAYWDDYGRPALPLMQQPRGDALRQKEWYAQHSA